MSVTSSENVSSSDSRASARARSGESSLAERRQRLLQQGHQAAVDLPPFDVRLAVPERRPRKLVRRPEPPRDLDRPQVGLLRLGVAPGSHLGRAQPEQHLAAQRLVRLGQVEGVQRPLVLRDRLLVGGALHRSVAGPARVAQRLRALTGAGGLREVPAQLRHVAVRVGAVQPLDRLADRPVQPGAGRDRQRLVDHLAHQGVREAVAARG